MKTATIDTSTITGYIRDLIIDNRQFISPDRGALLNSAGCSLFLYHYAEAYEDDLAYDQAGLFSQPLFDGVRNYQLEAPGTVSICSGVIGSAWALRHLKQEGFIDFGNELDHIDQVAVEFYNRMAALGNYDYLHGALGALFYLLSATKDAHRLKVLHSLLGHLLENCNRTDELLYLSDFDMQKNVVNNGIINLGLSHGTPSLIPVLCKAVQYDTSFAYLLPSIEKLSNTIIAMKNRSNTGSIYPYRSVLGQHADFKTRLGWCYGDLGIAVSLYQAAEVLKSGSLKSHCYEIFERASSRRSLEEGQVRDAALCHGAAGISHLFREAAKWYQNDPGFSATADYWLDISNDLIQPYQSVITGRSKFHQEHGFLNSFSLLEGLSGIGLAYLSKIHHSSNWQHILLLP
ncbi:hypothetical protein C7T94_03885 [Pedobacter yulinensis]|uniref:Lanthionine synthetase n=1 Tax=Pedobacter yulinensis TaxID=2126353 RepID=A0A2T3HN95_9SPHI|nr:lanthionine synthetase LanC family protein [Pedobacter yulinensis]PST83896.1 hypothetical protein C7T94_03885 [Pedobacter yulinensis]